MTARYTGTMGDWVAHQARGCTIRGHVGEHVEDAELLERHVQLWVQILSKHVCVIVVQPNPNPNAHTNCST
eukprot:COSAG03_NODE_1261_length_4447_cov_8.223321_4_plen_71_part_00